jgi:hypothetical protein
MKTRYSYVSNSSSSSFLLKESKATKNLTSKDWNEMIVSLFKDYENRLEDCLRIERELELEKDNHPLFCAFDMKTDRAEAELYMKDILEGWMASNCLIRNGKMQLCKKNVEYEWLKFCQKIRMMVENELIEERGCDYASAWFHIQSRDEIRKYPPVVDVIYANGTRKRINVDEKYLKMLEDKLDEMGLCDNYDVLKNEKTRFAIHFDENEYASIEGVSDEKGEWETKSGSYERLCEVFAKWLVGHGKVSSDFNWRSLMDDTLTVNMHEG